MATYAHQICGKCLTRALRRNRAHFLIRSRSAARTGNDSAALVYLHAANAILSPDCCR